MPELAVETAAGPIRGTDDGAVRVWKGIPYATARRWRAPEPAAPWSEQRDCTAFGPVCPQPANRGIVFAANTRQDEDCLSLNVWASPTIQPGDARPVVVWVHGGGFALGAGSQPHFHGGAFAGGGEIVLVTLNYRLGAFGFLDLSSAGVGDTNLALRDVLLALEWVRDSIAAFGGDPQNVTLAGHSAGAGLVTALLATPASAGLFARAISQSGPATSVYPADHAARVADALQRELGVDAAQLPSVDADALVAASRRLFLQIPTVQPGTLAFAPTVDDDILHEHPITAMAAGRAHPVPLILGSTRDETALMRFSDESVLVPSTRDQVRVMLAAMETAVPGRGLPNEPQTATAYAGIRREASRREAVACDLAFRMPCVWVAEAHSAHAPVHLYRFDWAPRFTRLTRGAGHSSELRYLWGEIEHYPRDPTFKLGGLRTSRAVSRRFRGRWHDYAATGDPGWPAYDRASRQSLVADSEDRVAVDLDARPRAAWGAVPLTFC
ncbi:MAG: carboxylesterase/lipase family protein [Solirubrobacteraceae bacterium]|nr:carboxylesterase/lipase family protein [Solirubrobacteraceae bacterium]